MFLEYVSNVLKKARYKQLDDASWFGEIPGFEGVWANDKTVERCREQLIEVLEEWLLLKVRDGDSIPQVEGMRLRFKKVA